jgi:GlcNAc-P-P-Und epimerase
MENILVTGASGFVGSLLIRKLLKEPNNYITALYCNNLPLYAREKFIDRVNWVQADLTRINNNYAILNGIKVLYHLAGYSSIKETASEKAKLELINVSITKNLAEACVKFDVKQFIYVSSIAACECSDSEIIDENNGFPKTYYGFSKKKAESYLIGISKGHYNYTILRPTALFGENHEGSILDLSRLISSNKMIIFGSGNNVTNFYYIGDFVEVLRNIKLNTMAYNEIFIASDLPMKLIKMVEIIYDILGKKTFIIRFPLFLGSFIALLFDTLSKITGKQYPFSRRRFNAMTQNSIYSNKKLLSILSQSPSVGLRHGLNKTIQWYLKTKLL